MIVGKGQPGVQVTEDHERQAWRPPPGCTYCGTTDLLILRGFEKICLWCSPNHPSTEVSHMAMPKPKTEGNYLRAPKSGQSVTFRILGDPVEYYVAFKTTENGGEKKISVVRHKSLSEFVPGEFDTMGKFGPTGPKYAMAFPVLSESETVMIFEITQKTILDSLYGLENNKKWGDLTTFDVTVTGDEDGKGYKVTPDPKSPLSDAGREAWEGLVRNGFDVRVLLDGKDPFLNSAPQTNDELANPNFDEGSIPF